MTRRRNIVAVVPAIVMALLAACAPVGSDDWDPSDPKSARAHAERQGYAEAVTVLDDGRVTKEEWRSIHLDWVGCMTELGYSFDPPLIDPVNGREFVENRSYVGGGDPDADGVDACYARYEDAVGQIYYLTTPAVMDPALMAAVHACLDDQGIPYGGDEVKLEDFYMDDEKDPNEVSQSAVTQCVETAFFTLYPELPNVGIGF